MKLHFHKPFFSVKLLLSLVVLILFNIVVLGQQKATTATGKKVILFDNGHWIYADSMELQHIKPAKTANLEIPKTTINDEVIKHTGYSLLFNSTHKQANWVAYELTKNETEKLYDRTDNFIADPKIKVSTDFNNDYKKSGYDRGHLAPAADMGWSLTTMAESFYYSNMSPQTPSFNRGIWKKLEEQVRNWAIENDSIYVITGPVLTNNLIKIGPNKISVPKYYYKVILDYTAPDIKGIGFILSNLASNEKLQHYAVTIDSIESITGIDFFWMLPHEQEYIIESKFCIACWNWSSDINANTKAGSNGIEPKENMQNNSNIVRCKATTKSGIRCKKTTSNPSGRCSIH